MRPGIPLARRGAAGLVVVLALGGCGASPAATPTSARAPGATTSALPAPADPAATTVAAADDATVAAHRRRLSRDLLALQDAAVALEAAARAGDDRGARAAWRRADAVRARLGIARGAPVGAGLRALADALFGTPDLPAAAALARALNDDAARTRRARLTAPVTAAEVAAAPREILEVASGDLAQPAVALGAELDALRAALDRARPAARASRRLPRVDALLAGLPASPAAAERRALAAAVGALLDDLARREARP